MALDDLTPPFWAIGRKPLKPLTIDEAAEIYNCYCVLIGEKGRDSLETAKYRATILDQRPEMRDAFEILYSDPIDDLLHKP